MINENIEKIPFLRSSYPGMTKSERRIAEYMAQQPEIFLKMTISEIADETESSEITVSRFCKKLGYRGGQELKQALTAYLLTSKMQNYHDIGVDDSCSAVAAKIFQNITDGLLDTLQLLNYRSVDRAAAVLRQARRIAVYGFGNSATVCRDITTRYLRLGFAVQDYSDSHMQVTSAAMLTPQDAVIAVSHTGATDELIQSVKVAKKRGAAVIALTSHIHSPLAKLADICLHGMGREVNYSSEAGASRLIHMAIADILYTRIAMADSEMFKDNMERMRMEISKKKSN